MDSAKIPRVYKFSAKLFEFPLHNADALFEENKSCVDNKMQTGFNNFLHCLDSYLDLLDSSTITLGGKTQVNIYGSVTLENGAIMRATSKFHNKSWFSDIAIAMDSDESDDYVSDQGLCYGQVIHHLYINNVLIKVITLLIYCLYFVDFIVSRSANRPSTKSRFNSMVRF